MRDAERPRVVFGAGTGYSAPETPEHVYFVRGPRTSAAMGGVPWITDPAILVRHLFKRTSYREFPCSFMPRWDSVSPELEEGCAKAGIHLIDPRRRVEDITAEIAFSDLLLTEALHGAVVADTLRVPWISIYGSRGHEAKWQDWCWSMEMVWNPIDAAEFTLRWARDYAVPQLSAQSVLDARLRSLDGAFAAFVADLKAGRWA